MKISEEDNFSVHNSECDKMYIKEFKLSRQHPVIKAKVRERCIKNSSEINLSKTAI